MKGLQACIAPFCMMPDADPMQFVIDAQSLMSQLMRWSSATRSWETFCSADPNILLYSVPGNPMTPSSILGRMCSINMTQLLTEISSFQSFEKMNALVRSSIV